MTIVEYINNLNDATSGIDAAAAGFGGVFDGFGPALTVGAWVGETLARYYGVATLVIASLDA
jgi:hypothetical protein